MADYLLKGAVTNAVNFPNITAEEAPRLRPWVKLAEQLGLFAGQLTDTSIKGIDSTTRARSRSLNTKPLTAAALAGVLRPLLSEVNMVSAAGSAKERGIRLEEATRGQEGAFDSYIRLTVNTDEYDRSVAGTVFSDGRPRIIQVRDIDMEFELAPRMLFIRNLDKPGFIGKFGSLMGEAGLNIATLNLGRDKPGGEAICMVAIDEPASEEILAKVRALPQVMRVNPLVVLTRLRGLRARAAVRRVALRASPTPRRSQFRHYLPLASLARRPMRCRARGDLRVRGERERAHAVAGRARCIRDDCAARPRRPPRLPRTSRVDAVTVFPTGAESDAARQGQARAR